jgi:xylulokinase
MNDFIVHRLTGNFATNLSNAGVTQLVDVSDQTWSTELCTLAGAPKKQFSNIYDAGRGIGTISHEVSQQTGLPVGLPVINGGHDQSCTALALGVTEPGQALLACGTSWVITSVTSNPDVASLPSVLDLNYHVVPGRWTVSQSLGGLGAALEWLVNLCWADLATRAERYRALDQAVQGTRPGSDGLLFLPVSGGHAAPAAMQQGGFLNLQLMHTRAHLARAVMEAAVCELRLALQAICDTGMRVDQLRMVGGATRSPVWPGVVAGVTGLPVRVTDSAQLPAVGAAMLAGEGAGLFKMDEALAHFAPPARDVDAHASDSSAYEQLFQRYLDATHSSSVVR